MLQYVDEVCEEYYKQPGQKLQRVYIKQNDEEQQYIQKYNVFIAKTLAEKENKMLIPDERDQGNTNGKRNQIFCKSLKLIKCDRRRGGDEQQGDSKRKHSIT
jgi:hypothetical protein